MMIDWRSLLAQTLRTPAAAAATILATPVARGHLWMAVIAVAACNAVVTGLTYVLFPLPPEFPAFLANPFSYFVIVAGGLVLLAHILTWVGRAMGGEGTLDELLGLMIWLQFVSAGLQLIGLLIFVTVPALGLLFRLAVGVLSFWIFLHFIKSGHRLESLGTAFIVLFAAFVGMIIGLSLILTLVGAGSLGVSANV